MTNKASFVNISCAHSWLLMIVNDYTSNNNGNGDGGKDNKTVRLMMRSGLVEFLIIDIVPLSPKENRKEMNLLN